MNISAASEQFKISKETPSYSRVPRWVCKSWDSGQFRAAEPFPNGCLKCNFATGILPEQFSDLNNGRGGCVSVTCMCTHTFTSITSIRPGQLTPEINVTPQDCPAGNWCYDWLPVCREGNWGTHIWDQALRKPLALWALSGASRAPEAHSCPPVPCHTPESWHFPVQGSLVVSPTSATGPHFHHRLCSGH